MSGQSLMPVTVSVHVYPDTPVRVRLYPEDNRVVLIVGDAPEVSTTLDVYLRRAELLALRDTLTAAAVDLDTTSTTSTDVTGGDAAETAVPVGHPAA